MGYHTSRNSEWLLPLVKAARRTVLRWRGQGVVASVYDTFDALDFETRNGQSPVLVKRMRTDYGWRLIWHLPAGIPSRKVAEQLDAFEEQVGGRIVLERHGADIFMDVVTAPLNGKVTRKACNASTCGLSNAPGTSSND